MDAHEGPSVAFEHRQRGAVSVEMALLLVTTLSLVRGHISVPLPDSRWLHDEPLGSTIL